MFRFAGVNACRFRWSLSIWFCACMLACNPCPAWLVRWSLLVCAPFEFDFALECTDTQITQKRLVGERLVKKLVLHPQA